MAYDTLISSETGGNACKVKKTALDSKCNTASEDDKNFTFEVGRVEALPEKEKGSQWKPFPSAVQCSELPKVICHFRTFF